MIRKVRSARTQQISLRTGLAAPPHLALASSLSCQGHAVSNYYSQPISHPPLRASLANYPLPLLTSPPLPLRSQKYISQNMRDNSPPPCELHSYPPRGPPARTVLTSRSDTSRRLSQHATFRSPPCESPRAPSPNQHLSPSILNRSLPPRHAPFQTPASRSNSPPSQNKTRCTIPAPDLFLSPCSFPRTGSRSPSSLRAATRVCHMLSIWALTWGASEARLHWRP
ncbi:hypothetical protein BD310DRAFT_933869 [Dichomitus squalens]|uniref:Uncharacterized protein n=1 Tax=Dichomitus squalens TaxID=114155 RepID=A0A4Q9PM94_9APHY|nr:hypothetical protein BD310DRAFT_933869 [Dichomitus squalens]